MQSHRFYHFRHLLHASTSKRVALAQNRTHTCGKVEPPVLRGTVYTSIRWVVLRRLCCAEKRLTSSARGASASWRSVDFDAPNTPDETSVSRHTRAPLISCYWPGSGRRTSAHGTLAQAAIVDRVDTLCFALQGRFDEPRSVVRCWATQDIAGTFGKL